MKSLLPTDAHSLVQGNPRYASLAFKANFIQNKEARTRIQSLEVGNLRTVT